MQPRAEYTPATAVKIRWQDRWLFSNFLRREIFSRYLGSISGVLWAFIHPLALLAVYAFVFSTVFRAGPIGGRSFLLYVAIALWPWLATQEGLQRGALTVVSNSALVRKVAFPHELLVYAAVAATFILQLAGYLVILVAFSLYGEEIHFSGLLIAIPLWLLLFVFVCGIALVLAAFQVFIRDIEHALMHILTLVMYVTPILYPLSVVPASLRGTVAINPLTYVMERFRGALLEGDIALRIDDLWALLATVIVYACGRWVFRRLSPHFEDFA